MIKLIRKLKSSLMKRFYIVTNGGYSVGKSYGVYFLFDWRHSIDKKVACRLYEDGQLTFMQNTVKDITPNYFFDIGAHAGLYSMLAQVKSHKTEVHAFEPDWQNYAQLYANLYLNKLYNKIHVHDFAISDKTGVAYFNRSQDTSRGTRHLSENEGVKVNIKRFDDVCDSIDKTAFFKIDVEGYECNVIEGAKQFLKNNKCILLIESLPANIQRLRIQMEQLGYSEVMADKFNDYVFQNQEFIKA